MKWSVYAYGGERGKKTVWSKLQMRIVFPDVVTDDDVRRALNARGLSAGTDVRGNGAGTIDVLQRGTPLYRLLDEVQATRYDARERQAKHRKGLWRLF